MYTAILFWIPFTLVAAYVALQQKERTPKLIAAGVALASAWMAYKGIS